MAKEEKYTDEESLDDNSIYDEEGREDLVEDDEMSAEEEGFMRGYEDSTEREDEVDVEEKKGE